EHVASGEPVVDTEISAAVVDRAVRLGRDYLLPHALAAFSAMGVNEKVADARHMWGNICRRSAYAAHSAHGGPKITRRDIQNWNRRRFPLATDMDHAVSLLVTEGYLRPVAGPCQTGRGHKSPSYEVNPLALKRDTRAHCAQRTHLDEENVKGDA